MNTGISNSTLSEIFSIFSNFPEVEKAVLFGSRAKGNFYEGSDIDIAVYGEKLDFKQLLNISIALDKIELLQAIDLVHFEKIKEPELNKHIERVGIRIYDLAMVSKR
ncbi:putative nucleotidyltransferase [Algoriphagus ratkowskyi]|uniref:Nucleotidyltransferase domain-containing protein n=1 Tax=Algoriphagus ratkowskyi TaxID=57028 RepID=A0A2W7REV4_9BACT|nr:nucleotidyltransferase domain-containing protein [Algoriphagus ratkowskyi]PZX57656.1 putative nucleotidyltransferase [Algoriphagus ratkowskyi]TXD78927.1 nucleotidyltransferase domain-containing protein [Algoriphagus ratkowskyi]